MNPTPILCVGLKSSGSTWVFNVVAEILRASLQRKQFGTEDASVAIQPGGVMAFFGDSVDSFPEGAEHARYLVVKTHNPARSLRFIAGSGRAPVIVSIREPRDAVASLMQRFGLSFDTVLRDFKNQANRLIPLVQGIPFLLFRYEDRFFEHDATLRDITRFLYVNVTVQTRERIARELSAPEIASRLEELAAGGILGREPDPQDYDPRTHLHTGHLGDGATGKFRTLLTREQQDATITTLRDYCRTFGYATPLSRASAPSRTATQQALIPDRVFNLEPLALDTQYSFGEAEQRRWYEAITGFGERERLGRWTIDDRALLMFRLPPDLQREVSLDIEMCSAVRPGHPGMEVSLAFNGALVGRWRFEEPNGRTPLVSRVSLPVSAIGRSGEAWLCFEINDPIEESASAAAPRRLGVALMSLLTSVACRCRIAAGLIGDISMKMVRRSQRRTRC